MTAAAPATRSAGLWPSAGDGDLRALSHSQGRRHAHQRGGARQNVQITCMSMRHGAQLRRHRATPTGITPLLSP